MHKIFIDGREGTTGLEIYDRLSSRKDIELILIDEDKRKDINERKKLINSADIVFLCLPDDAAREAVTLLDDSGLRYRTIGHGSKVSAQLPEAGQRIARGTQIILYVNAEPSEDLETVPDLSGMSYEQARDALSYYGIYIQTKNAITDPTVQIVSSQSLAAGTKVKHGSIIEVTLIDSDDSMLGKY